MAGMWLLLIAIYMAPADAVNWQGTWELGMTKLIEQRYESERACLDKGREIKARLNEGMLAPVRTHCIEVAGGLPKGAAR